jgi:hypothetical protein
MKGAGDRVMHPGPELGHYERRHVPAFRLRRTIKQEDRIMSRNLFDQEGADY